MSLARGARGIGSGCELHGAVPPKVLGTDDRSRSHQLRSPVRSHRWQEGIKKNLLSSLSFLPHHDGGNQVLAGVHCSQPAHMGKGDAKAGGFLAPKVPMLGRVCLGCGGQARRALDC